MRYLVMDGDRSPRLYENPYDGFNTKAEAVEQYIATVKFNRTEYFNRINRNMNRVANCDRKIRQALKLKD